MDWLTYTPHRTKRAGFLLQMSKWVAKGFITNPNKTPRSTADMIR